MVRYDQGRPARLRGYDAGYGRRDYPGHGGGRRRAGRYGGDYEGDFGFVEDLPGVATSGSGIYGPARYGLGPYYRRLLDRRRPDAELAEEVEEALFYDTWVDAESITVEVVDGVATLNGELPSHDEIRYAIDDAWDVDGIRGVRSQLSVRRSEG